MLKPLNLVTLINIKLQSWIAAMVLHNVLLTLKTICIATQNLI